MAVTPVQVPVSTSVPTLTLAAGSAGGLGVAVSIDPVNDYLSIYTASATATQGINRNTLLGLSSAPVGVNDYQTLTNKILTNPTINAATLSGTLSGTYTLGGTPTFPASVATLTGTQTLTNKTLTSPVINTPTITNATLSSDVLAGYTTANTGTIYGMSVTAGLLSSSAIVGQVVNGSIATGGLYTTKVYNPYKFSAYSSATTTITPSFVYTKIGLQTKTIDTSSNFDATTNYRFTASAAGFYYISGKAEFLVLTAIIAQVAIFKNGAEIRESPQVQNATGGTNTIGSSISGLFSLAAGDYVELWGRTNQSSTASTATGGDTTFLDGFLISAT